MKILLLTASSHGQTIKIMQHIAAQLPQALAYDLIDLHTKPQIHWPEYQSVIIGASVVYGHYHPHLFRFIQQHHVELNNRPSAFFGVNLVACNPKKASPITNPDTAKLLKEIPWRPQHTAVFAGAIPWSRYRFWQKALMIVMMKKYKRAIDTSKDIEYTNWPAVNQFTQEITQSINKQLI